MLFLAWRGHLILIVYFTFLASIAFVAGIPAVGFVSIGVGIGVLSRDLGLFRRFVQVWPVLSQVFNWQKIDELLASPLQAP